MAVLFPENLTVLKAQQHQNYSPGSCHNRIVLHGPNIPEADKDEDYCQNPHDALLLLLYQIARASLIIF
jgi:hypothetical protein